jgi:hypothetical protein
LRRFEALGVGELVAAEADDATSGVGEEGFYFEHFFDVGQADLLQLFLIPDVMGFERSIGDRRTTVLL